MNIIIGDTRFDDGSWIKTFTDGRGYKTVAKTNSTNGGEPMQIAEYDSWIDAEKGHDFWMTRIGDQSSQVMYAHKSMISFSALTTILYTHMGREGIEIQ